jgi:hypothetical protein
MLVTDVATAAADVDKPARGVRLIEFRPLVKNTLRGFCTVEILPLGLRIIDCVVHVSHGRAWVGFPSKVQLDNTDKVRTGADGKPLYATVIKWRDRNLANRFSDVVVSAIRRAHPGALDGDGAS